MEKIYSAKLVYRSYVKYFLKSIFKSSVLLISFLSVFSFSAIIYVVKIGLQSIAQHKLIFINVELGLEILKDSLVLLPILLGFSFLIATIMWFQKFYIQESKIVDLFPRKREIDINNVERIVLISPTQAQIITRDPAKKLYVTCYWFGNDEYDWLNFLNLLRNLNPSIEHKIYVNGTLWGGNKIKKSSITDSYPEVVKLHSKDKIS